MTKKQSLRSRLIEALLAFGYKRVHRRTKECEIFMHRDAPGTIVFIGRRLGSSTYRDPRGFLRHLAAYRQLKRRQPKPQGEQE